MYKIPLTNSPNQSFNVIVPVNDENKDLTLTLNYNEVADYWSLTIADTQTGQDLVSQIPMLESYNDFSNILIQLGYLEIGSAFVIALDETPLFRPNEDDLGTKYILVWGDNE